MATHYQTIVEHSREAVLILQKCQIQYANKEAARLLCVPESALPGLEVHSFLHSNEKTWVAREICALEQTEIGSVSELQELQILAGNGVEKSVDVRLVPVIWDEETAVICYLNDLTTEKSETETQEREAILSALIDRAYNGVVVIQDSQIMYLNDQMALILGYSVEEMLNTNFVDYLHPEDKLQVIDLYTRRMAGEKVPTRYESRLVHKTGRSVEVQFNADVVKIQGEPADFVFVRDITERKEQQAALERQNRELSTLFNATKAISSDLTLEKVLETVAFQMIHASDTTGCSISIWHKDRHVIETLGEFSVDANKQTEAPGCIYDLHKYPATLKVLETKKPCLIRDDAPDADAAELALKAREGIFVLVILPLIVRDEVIGIVELFNERIYQDLTEDDIKLASSLAAQAAIAIQNARLLQKTREQGHQLEQIISSVPDGVLLLDENKNLIMANPAAKSYLPLLTQCEIGKVLYHLGERPLSELLENPPNGLWHEVEGGKRSFDVVARALVTHPAAGGWVMVIHDITREKEVQKHLQQQNRLAAVGQLAAGIAHDFNNILTVISLYTDLVNRSESHISPQSRQRLSVISQQANRASDLIEQILDFSRRSVLERQPMDFLPLLKEVVKLLDRTLIEHIHVNLEFQIGEYIVNADPTRLQQMLMNVAVNARDAMPKGGKLTFQLSHLKLDASNQVTNVDLKPGNWLKLEISDTGMGIDDDVLPHVFNPFFTTKEPGMGSGLGLAQVWGIVQQHEGHIIISKTDDQGTTLELYLPLCHQETPILTDDTCLGVTDGSREIVLVVEDNVMTQEVMVESLNILNYEVVTAVHGLEALEIMTTQGHNISLIISDVVMPEMGGISLLHTLRQRGWKTAVLLLTGHPLNKELDESLHYPDVEWLAKPVNLEQLSDAVNRCLKSKKVHL